ncbi:MAG TPA: DUF1949 domain-containing protein, partial [Enterococcus casseliflavus]|nr:DUF1949 domain-containing protein [Enterococcus casseliflavus]
HQELALTIDYPLLGKLQNYLELQNIYVKDIAYTEKIVVTLMIPEATLADQEATLIDLLQGQVQLNKGKTEYVERLIEEPTE